MTCFNYFSLALLVLIVAMGRNKLLCSSMNLIETLDNPTIFCSISGDND